MRKNKNCFFCLYLKIKITKDLNFGKAAVFSSLGRKKYTQVHSIKYFFKISVNYWFLLKKCQISLKKLEVCEVIIS